MMFKKKRRGDNGNQAGQLIDEHASAERADPHNALAPSPSSAEATIPQVEIEDPEVLSRQQQSSSSRNSIRRFKCSHCDKKFNRKNSLNRHELTHLMKTFICEHYNCGRAFALKEYLDAHLKTHLSFEWKDKEDSDTRVPPSDIIA